MRECDCQPEIDALEEKNAALRAEVEFHQTTIEGLIKQRDKAEAEVERLRAEVAILMACQREREKLAAAVEALYFAANWHADRDVDAAALWTAVRDAAGIKPGQTMERVGPDRGCTRAEKLAAALREIADGPHYDGFCKWLLHAKGPEDLGICDCHVGIAARALADGEEP